MRPRHALTNAEVHRMRCFRCNRRPGYAVWRICADKNRQRVVCVECNILLNQMVLRWMRDPRWRQKLMDYTRRIAKAHGEDWFVPIPRARQRG